MGTTLIFKVLDIYQNITFSKTTCNWNEDLAITNHFTLVFSLNDIISIVYLMFNITEHICVSSLRNSQILAFTCNIY